MSEHDDLDAEIDRDMGWHRGESARIRKRGDDGPRRKAAYWQALVAAARATSPLFNTLGRSLRTLAHVAFFPLISPLGHSKRFDIHGDAILVQRSLARRLFDGALTRIVLTPVILILFFVAVIYLTTHPQPIQASSTPEAYGLYFKRAVMTTSDGQGIAAWYVPPLKSGEIAFNQEDALLQKWPAAILVHSLGQTHDAYLPLTQRLHDVGFAVLLLDTRGQGESAAAAVTFGLRERLDILAGVRYLHEQNNIDTTKICLVGQGVAATAALHAASLDSSIAAVVADGLPPRFDQRVNTIFDNTRLPTRWMAPLYSLCFEVALRERVSQLDAETLLRSIQRQPVMFIAYAPPKPTGEFASLQDIMALAASVPARHEVVIVPGLVTPPETKIIRFLATSTHWRGPKINGAQALQKLLDAEVK